MKTKVQIINRAYQELKIWGLTSTPQNEDLVYALGHLEEMMYEIGDRLNYNFESTPNLNSSSYLPSWATNAISLKLAVRLCLAFGKESMKLSTRTGAAWSKVLARARKPNRVAYPSRFPTGSGNYNPYTAGMFIDPQYKNDPNVIQAAAGDKINIVWDASSDLQGTTISTVNYTNDDQISITLISNTSTTVSMTVQLGNPGIFNIVLELTGANGTIVNRAYTINVFDGLEAQ